MSRLSSFTERWQEVPAPQLPLLQLTPNVSAALSNHTYQYPYTHGAPAGVYEVRNAIVDRSQKVGAWSEPNTQAVKSGWFLWARGDNLPPNNDDVGIVWKVTCVSLDEADPLGCYVPGGEYLFTTAIECDRGDWRSIVPYSAVEPVYRQIQRTVYRILSLDKLTYGGRHQTVHSCPSVIFTQVPLVAMDIAYSRITHTGETELSPPLVFIPPAPPVGWTAADTCSLELQVNEPHPQGTLGYYLYARFNGMGPYVRLNNAIDGNEMFQVNCKRPRLMIDYANPTTHQASTPAQSYLGKLNVALMDTGDAIVIDESPVIHYSPVIDEWRSSGNVTFKRSITGPEGSNWRLEWQQAPNCQITYYPNVLIYNAYSRWVGCQSNRNGGAYAGLVTADWSGGQCFGNQFESCYFGDGLRVQADSAGWNSHTASELQFTDCMFGGAVPIWLAGNQTANIRFHRLHAAVYGIINRASTCIYIDAPSPVRFTGGTYLECPTNAIFTVTTATIMVDDVWVDQGFVAFVDVMPWGSARFKVNGGKLNAWTVPGGTLPNLIRTINPHPTARSRFIATDVALQFNNLFGLMATNPLPNSLELRFDDTDLDKFTTLKEPTEVNYDAAQIVIYGDLNPLPPIPEPGYVISIPAQGSAEALTMLIPGQTVRANSLTGQSKVTRQDWWA